MRFLDRVLVFAVLGYLVSLLLGVEFDTRDDPPFASPPSPGTAAPLPAPPAAVAIAEGERALPDIGRGRVALLETGERRRGSGSTGTAWSAGNGVWLSARHVVESCTAIRLGREGWEVPRVLAADSDADVLAFAGVALPPIPLATEAPSAGDALIAVGYPQGQAGAAHLRLRGTELVRLSGSIAGRRTFRAYVWDVESYPRIRGDREDLGGISGGAVVNAAGEAVGVAIYSSPRRRAMGSVALSTVHRVLAAAGVQPASPAAGPGLERDLDTRARSLLWGGTISRVLCRE